MPRKSPSKPASLVGDLDGRVHGGQTEKMTSDPSTSAAIDPTSVIPAASARAAVALLRPSEDHLTSWPSRTSAAPIPAPISARVDDSDRR